MKIKIKKKAPKPKPLTCSELDRLQLYLGDGLIQRIKDHAIDHKETTNAVCGRILHEMVGEGIIDEKTYIPLDGVADRFRELRGGLLEGRAKRSYEVVG